MRGNIKRVLKLDASAEEFVRDLNKVDLGYTVNELQNKQQIVWLKRFRIFSPKNIYIIYFSTSIKIT